MDEASQTFEKIFQTITSVVLGKKLSRYADYEEWLTKLVSKAEKTSSCISKELVYLPPFDFYHDIRSRVVTMNEGYDVIGKRQLTTEQLNSLSLSGAGEILRDISITTPETVYGVNSNVVECSLYYDTHGCFRSSALNRSKYALYSFWPRQSEHTLGCYYVFSSQFCIKCYNSENLVRCLELSDCNNCSDSYFCHNCENLSNCMFCFNTKAKKYAIANVGVGRERYMKIKQMLLEEIVKTLEREKRLGISIFSLS